MRRLTATAAALAALPLVLAACSPDTGDFKSEAEQYIESREFSEDAGLLRYSDVECEEPASTDTDTRFTCAATAEDGTRWLFDVDITGAKSLEVLTPPAPLDTAPTESSTPPGGAPTTSAPAGTRPTASTSAASRPTTTANAPSTTARPATTTTSP